MEVLAVRFFPANLLPIVSTPFCRVAQPESSVEDRELKRISAIHLRRCRQPVDDLRFDNGMLDFLVSQ